MKTALCFVAIALLLTTTACDSTTSANSPAPNSAQDSGVKAAQPPLSDSAKADPKKSTDTKALSDASVPGAKVIAAATAQPKLKGKATVVMTVNGSPITIELDGDKAPITAGNFLDLVNRGVYDGTKFHRVVKTPTPFVAQGGDPQSKDPNVPVDSLGSGNFIDPQTKQARYIPLEILPEGADEPIYGKTLPEANISKRPQLTHAKGAIAMARTNLPDSASAQFYFALGNLDFLDGNYAVFGHVTNGLDVVENIKQGDVVESAKVTQGSENLQ